MKSLSQDRGRFLGVVAGRIVPEIREMDRVGLARFYGLIDRALCDRPVKVQRQFGTLLGLVRWLPLLRWGTSFERLGAKRQDTVLRWLQVCPVRPLRQGLWALKTMVFMGFYGQVETWESIGYTPRSDGNEALHA